MKAKASKAISSTAKRNCVQKVQAKQKGSKKDGFAVRVSFKRLAKAGLPSSHPDVVEFKKAALKARQKGTPAAHEAYKALERKLLVISGQQAASDISERVDSAVQKMNGALTDLFEIRGGAVDVAAGLSSCSELLQSKKRKLVSGAGKGK